MVLAYLTLSRLSKTKEVLVVGITTGVDKIRRMFAGLIIQKRKMFACKVVDHTHRIVLIPLTCSLPPQCITNSPTVYDFFLIFEMNNYLNT